MKNVQMNCVYDMTSSFI